MSMTHLDFFLALNRLIGSRCAARYREMLHWEALDASEVLRRREAREGRLLAHAATAIPFYRDRVKQGTPPALDAFPVLTRTDVQTRYKDLMSARLRREFERRTARRSYGWVEVSTGGSTGRPTTVIHDAAFRDSDRAARLYAMRLCGFPFGTPHFRLWGCMRDINAMQDSRMHGLMGWLSREHLLNAFLMSPERMEGYLGEMRRSDAVHMMAYVDAAHHLALLARRRRIPAPTLETVMACAGTVTDDARQVIQETFGARVHNKYGSRECGDMVCECSRGGLHIFANRCHIEVVDERGAPLPPGLSGRMLITILDSYDFPLIRYDIGDVGALRSGACPCRSGLPLMAAIEGRDLEFLTATGGGYVSPVAIRHLVGVVHNQGQIERFQMIQEGPGEFLLAIQPTAGAKQGLPPAVAQSLLADLVRLLGQASRIRIESVDRIAPSESGKYLYCLNRTKGTSCFTPRLSAT